MLTHDLQPIYVCNPCLEHNLITAIHIRDCNKCGQHYCIHATSTIDPAYCIHCLHDVNMTINMYRAPIEDTGATKLTKSIKFGGTHYLFHQRKIATMDETELELALEYHRMIFNSMVFERERKRNAKLHRNVGVVVDVNDAGDPAPKRRAKRPVATNNNNQLVQLLSKLSPAEIAKLTAALQAQQQNQTIN